MTPIKIDLQDFRTPLGDTGRYSKVLGVEEGKKASEQLRGHLPDKIEEVEIRIPEDIGSINPSFLEELFSEFVEKTGFDGLIEKVEGNKVRFVNESNGNYNIEFDLAEALSRLKDRETNARIQKEFAAGGRF